MNLASKICTGLVPKYFHVGSLLASSLFFLLTIFRVSLLGRPLFVLQHQAGAITGRDVEDLISKSISYRAAACASMDIGDKLLSLSSSAAGSCLL